MLMAIASNAQDARNTTSMAALKDMPSVSIGRPFGSRISGESPGLVALCPLPCLACRLESSRWCYTSVDLKGRLAASYEAERHRAHAGIRY
jgi:hypothetical protein